MIYGNTEKIKDSLIIIFEYLPWQMSNIYQILIHISKNKLLRIALCTKNGEVHEKNVREH